MEVPETRYVRSGGASIAYSVTGEGPLDVVFIPSGFHHLELWWENALRARFARALAGLGRLIQFDKRGTGLSDRGGPPPGLETRMDDIHAVMDAANSRRALVFAVVDATPMAMLFAATFPERVSGLALWAPRSVFVRTPDQPWLPDSRGVRRVLRGAGAAWRHARLLGRGDP